MIRIEPASMDLSAISSMVPNIRRYFPAISHPLFKQSILKIIKIIDGIREKGLVVNISPFGEFRAFGQIESMLFVYPEFQRQGLGRAVVSLLIKEAMPRFFVSANSNTASSAFFTKHPSLILAHSNPRYCVYKTP
jgi:GNAT superfamily N-acetyltransferase